MRSFGYQFIEPGEGYLACGYVGKGRLEEPETIVSHLQQFFSKTSIYRLRGKKFLITAGPTREAIDPVRFITNHSTGKMGYALAEEAIKLGAEVTLISGPVNITAPAKAHLFRLNQHAQMYDAVMALF